MNLVSKNNPNTSLLGMDGDHVVNLQQAQNVAYATGAKDKQGNVVGYMTKDGKPVDMDGSPFQGAK